MGLAFLAGLASFLSPCVLPLIPVYLAFLAGVSIQDLAAGARRGRVMANAAFFVLGFSAVFVSLGASASLLGQWLEASRAWIERVGGAVLVLFGLWMLGVLRIGALQKDARVHLREKPAGLAGSALVGAAFAAGWTPCVGPVLSAILVLAGRSGSVAQGTGLLAAYSLGFALPLLACALAAERALGALNRVKPYLPAVERATGAVLVLLGLVLMSGWYSRLATWPLSYFPGWVRLFGRLGL